MVSDICETPEKCGKIGAFLFIFIDFSAILWHDIRCVDTVYAVFIYHFPTFVPRKGTEVTDG